MAKYNIKCDVVSNGSLVVLKKGSATLAGRVFLNPCSDWKEWVKEAIERDKQGKKLEESAKCHAGCGNESQVTLVDDVEYHLCQNCLLMLITRNLSSGQWKELMKIHSKHKIPFLLHDDFYNENGIALQPYGG
jgi:hypothetical protein